MAAVAGRRDVGILAVARGLGVVVGCSRDLAGQLLESLALGLGDEEGGEDTAEHEEREDLHDVVEPWRLVVGGGMALGTEWSEDDLCDDGADLARGGGEAVGGGSVACWEAFSWHDEGGGVGAEVEEELA